MTPQSFATGALIVGLAIVLGLVIGQAKPCRCP